MLPADKSPSPLSRRAFLTAVLSGAASLTGCVNVPSSQREPNVQPLSLTMPPRPFGGPLSSSNDRRLIYAAMEDHGHAIPAVPFEKISPEFLRQEVDDPTGERPGTIVVHTSTHFLYLVLPGRRAMRYGVGLGRAGFEWSGRAEIARKAEWPKWHPPEEMIERQPELEQYRTKFDKATGEWRGGMEPGIMNPLGARALYIYQDGKDTLYRIHGSPEWWTIGRSVSSGCVRMLNQDVIDLYGRVPVGSPILVTDGLRSV
ncbi:L,D-transpeptidase [Chelativorans sp. Marseille-P2723]|uniref:L,D-transpeptidase n=1 Tax=Chelativorans sp. Marseille-P2723 TaxID=2709133 RepID=UPI001570AB79|nr:L,D-transpeptidase [Chelativorans sp. Marseille-P2723]